MGKIFCGMAMSLDGYISSSNGDLSWLNKAMKRGEDYGFAEMMGRTGSYIMGANTYRESMQYAGSGGDKTKTYIVTHDENMEKTGDNVEFFNGDLKELAERAKAETDKDVYLYGGSNLVHQFINEDLVDELNISVIPILLGGGVSFFGKTEEWKKLKLRECKEFESGIVILRYEVR